MIHPTAIVSAQAKIATNAEIGPYCIIEGDVTIGNHCKLDSHVVLKNGTCLQDHVSIGNFAVIGGNPQDHKFDPSISTKVEIGKHTSIREGVTIHRATRAEKPTRVGENCLLMAYCHVGHDTQIGNNVTIANQTLLSGCIEVSDYVNISGGVVIHQFTRIGESSMIGGHSAIGFDIPPYTIAAKRGVLGGFNLVGLKRRGFTQETISDLKSCYKKIYMGAGTFEKRLQDVLKNHQPATPEGRNFLNFFETKPNKRFVMPEMKGVKNND